MDGLLNLQIIDGPVPWIVYGIAAVFVLFLLIRKPGGRRMLVSAIWIVAGAALAAGLYVLVNVTDMFGDPQPLPVLFWAMAAFAAIGLAIANFWKSTWWRKLVAFVGIIVFAIAGTIGVNAVYGLNPTVADLFGVVSGDPIAVPTPSRSATAPSGPIYESWKAPAGMPAKGEVGTEAIPGTVSKFDARPAGIYLPPAAQVADAPALPLVIFMMGFPGNPDPSAVATALDEYAAKNDGLAPIVIVADQLGSSGSDPACADSSAYGNAETYIKTDVVNWARANLNVIDDAKYWVIGGYSNGGGCANKYGAQEPGTFKNIFAVSGEEFPGSDDPDSVKATIYGGDDAKFEAAKTINIMKAAAPGTYTGVNAVYTIGADDGTYGPATTAVSNEAKAVGMTVSVTTIPGAGHTGDALTSGLTDGFGVLYPILGLSAP